MLQFRGSATFADNVEIIVGEGSQLTVASVQDWADDAVHHTHHHALVKRDGSLRHLAVAFGGDLVRMNTSVRYGVRWSRGAARPVLRRRRPASGEPAVRRSQSAKNPQQRRLQGRAAGRGAHTVWIGDVLIRKVAEGIETYESNKNLVLTDGCRADSVPNLEIETGEIVGAERLDHRPVRRRAAVLPAQPRYLGIGGSSVGGPRLLRRHHSQDRCPELESQLLQTLEAAGGQHQRRDWRRRRFRTSVPGG